MVYEAVLAGRIDYARAWVFSQALGMLDDDTARAIATATLAKAEGWTPAKLRERLAYRARKADPDLARRRYRRSVADRRVCIGQDDDGTARLSGLNLPVDRAAAAENRLDRLARAAKADGDVRTLDQLRADAMLDALTGEVFRLRPTHDPYTAHADHEAAQEDAHLKANTAANMSTAKNSTTKGDVAKNSAAEDDADDDIPVWATAATNAPAENGTEQDIPAWATPATHTAAEVAPGTDGPAGDAPA